MNGGIIEVIAASGEQQHGDVGGMVLTSKMQDGFVFANSA